MSDQVKIRLYIGTGFAGAEHVDYEYVDRSDWDSMSEEDREKYLEEAAQDFLGNHIDYSAVVVED